MLTIDEFKRQRAECGLTIRCGLCVFMVADETDAYGTAGWCCEHHHQTRASAFCRSFEKPLQALQTAQGEPVAADPEAEEADSAHALQPSSGHRTGADLRRWRLDEGMSQKALGVRLGVSQAAVSKLEKADALPKAVEVKVWGRA